MHAPTSRLVGVGLASTRGPRRLFEGLDISLDAGTVTWLRGANGSGKTSLLKILAGVSTPAAGEIFVEGARRSRTNAGSRRAPIHYVGHANALTDDLTLAESLAFLARLWSLDHPAALALSALDQMGLTPQRNVLVRHLSQGQRRRGAIARLALVPSDGIWLLDEPYDSLDVDGVERLSSLIETHAARGGVVMLTGHQPILLDGALQFDLEQHAVGQPAGRRPGDEP